MNLRWRIGVAIAFFLIGLVFRVAFRNAINLSKLRVSKLPQERMQLQKSNDSSALTAPAVIVQPKGGVGNQLFMFAAAYSLSRRMEVPLFIQVPDPCILRNRTFKPHEREFALDHFNLSGVQQMSDQIQPPLSVKYDEMEATKKVIPTDKIIELDDYFESEIYFEDYKSDIVSQLSLIVDSHRIGDTLREIVREGRESVMVHVRRGDFITNGIQNRSLPMSYYLRAMKLVDYLNHGKRVIYFVFSDDINYVRAQLSTPSFKMYDKVFVHAETSLEEFLLMSMCRHAVISSSTFSWWAAYLIKNPHKIVIGPFPKHKRRLYLLMPKELRDVKRMVSWKYPYPDNWVTINPYEDFSDMF